jgi:Fanconi-associated nuclease 1
MTASLVQVSIEGRPLNYQMGRKSQFVGLDDEVCSVEHLALQHYAAESNGGWRGTHCEGGGVTTLFVLLFWDVVFAAVPDVFQHPFQPGPLDLFTPEFGVARQPLVAARLADIERGNGPALLRSTWNAHHGQVCLSAIVSLPLSHALMMELYVSQLGITPAAVFCLNASFALQIG